MNRRRRCCVAGSAAEVKAEPSRRAHARLGMREAAEFTYGGAAMAVLAYVG